MKTLLFLIALTFHAVGWSQITSVATNHEPLMYIDSIRVPNNIIFDSNKIEAINVIKTKDSTAAYGKIYIKIKKNVVLKFLTAADLAKMYNIPSASIVLFSLDNELLKDTSNFRIDSSYILEVKTIKSSEIKYLPKNIPNLEILNIVTATQSNIEKKNSIRIRGNSTPG